MLLSLSELRVFLNFRALYEEFMAGKEISERHFEMLFTWAALQDATLGKMGVHAPTSYQEFKNGYDAKMAGAASFREIYLQFKAPHYTKAGRRCRISITPHQHALLQNRYPAKSAYYVFSLIRSLPELNTVHSQLTSASGMLLHYVCVDAAALPAEVSFLHIDIPEDCTDLPKVRYKIPEDEERPRTAEHEVGKKDVLHGKTLMRHFKGKEAGYTVKPTKVKKSADVKRGVVELGLTQLEPLREAKTLKASEFGIAFRTAL